MWYLLLLFLNALIVKNCEETERASAAANHQFMLDILRVLPYQETNVFFSPLSIAVAFGMVSLGAGGNTLDEISKTFHFDEVVNVSRDPFSIHKLFEKMITYRDQESNFTLSLANRLFPRQGFNIKEKFLDETKKYYKAAPQEVDFSSGEGETIINEWVEKETNNKIKDLFAPDSLMTAVLVLVNAIYFKGNWLIPFSKEDTYDEDFSNIDNKKTRVKMMKLTMTEFPYVEDDELNVQVLNLPYAADSLSMIVVLPKEGKFSEVISQLTSKKLRDLVRNSRKTTVNLKLPKFKLNTKYSLVEPLQKLGINDLFNNANLTGIADGDLFVSEVVHQAFVEVNEEGTEAAAATGVAIAESEAIRPESEVDFFVNRPFLFVIVDDRFDMEILFAGTVISL